MFIYGYNEITIETCENFYKFGGITSVFDGDKKEIKFIKEEK